MEHLTQEQLDAALIEGALPAATQAHLAECPPCAQALAEAKSQLSALKSFAHAHYERVMQPALRSQVISLPSQPAKRRIVFTPQFALAAMLFLTVGVGTLLFVRNPVAVPTNSTAHSTDTGTVASTTAASTASDDDADTLLLQRIASARGRSVPQALHPAALLLAERTRTTTTSGSSSQND